MDEVREVSAEAGNPLTFEMELLKSGKKVIGVRFFNIKSANSRKKLLAAGAHPGSTEV